MHMSQRVFAMRIRTSTETPRNWENDKSKPNVQAALLIRLVERYPDMPERLFEARKVGKGKGITWLPATQL